MPNRPDLVLRATAVLLSGITPQTVIEPETSVVERVVDLERAG